MDQQQREQFRDVVVAAMDKRGLSAASTAKLAGISPTTMTKVTNAEEVGRGIVVKLRNALGILALAEAQAAEGYSLDVEIIRDAVGMWLRDVEPSKRAEKVARLFASIANDDR